jgi:hypothetical protein
VNAIATESPTVDSTMNTIAPLAANVARSVSTASIKLSSAYMSSVRSHYSEFFRNFLATAVFFNPGLGVYLLWIVGVWLPGLRLFVCKSREVLHSHF